MFRVMTTPGGTNCPILMAVGFPPSITSTASVLTLLRGVSTGMSGRPALRSVWANLASGSAYMWLSAWRHHGWPVSSTPIVGSVAWFPYNHVAYVQAINSDGSVNIEEYNWGSNHTYGRRTIAASD